MKNYIPVALFFSLIIILVFYLNIIPEGTYTRTLPENVVLKEKYPSEKHLVTTDDGYILTVYRIPGIPGSIPVYLQHGMESSSYDWLHAGKNGSLAFMLWDAGYDVWMGNARGNTYSKQHKTLSTSDPEFWKFSWTEIGMYDVPAAIKYIHNLTQKKILFIGYSMGCSTFSVMATRRPEYAENVKAMIAISPAVYEYHIYQPLLRSLAPYWKEIQTVLEYFNIRNFLGRNNFLDFFANRICTIPVLQHFMCDNLIFLFGGFNRPLLPEGISPLAIGTFPAGTSVKVFLHWLQQMNVNKFRDFDYGPTENLKIYNSTEPPIFDLSKIQVPIAAFYSNNDWIVGTEDVKKFYEQVPKKLGIFEVDPSYSHFDYIWALNAAEVLHPKLLDIMSRFKN